MNEPNAMHGRPEQSVRRLRIGTGRATLGLKWRTSSAQLPRILQCEIRLHGRNSRGTRLISIGLGEAV